MKIRCLLTCIVSLVIVFPLQAQVGKEMKAFRNKEGITVTMLTPSLYKLYKQSDMSIAAEEALNNMKEINVMYVDKKRATPKVVEEINQRLIPIMENESKYTLVRSHQGVYGQERLYVTQNNEQITALVLWNEEREQLSVIELKGNIDLDNVDEIAAALNVKGLDRLAYINTPAEGSSFAERMGNPMDLLKRMEERFGVKRDSLFGEDPFGTLRERFGNMGSMEDMMKRAEEAFRNMGSMFNGMDGMSESISNGLEVIRENGKTRIKVNATNSELAYLIDGVEYAADSLKNGIPEEIANVIMVTEPGNAKKSHVIINTLKKSGQFISYSNGVLKYKYKNQEFTVNPEKLSEPSLLVNNRLTRTFNVDPMQIIQIRPATESERKILNAPSAQVVIVTDEMNFGF
ncbi:MULTISPECIES: DUF4252 domain-containing protein [Butyricimonas]|jgi:hypothetical protein|uniref:DUF4252 domain-containing protein n=1 Tax=Butyricimonas hominis TaxID=2763032 RepID=A0ABR7CW00_9BACT|nr:MULTISPECIES: DUF4252 domain-containing protein [Butyricimonas]MBC5619856.1 DUF4252 domain-containing protein [Butyricimonas hominis]